MCVENVSRIRSCQKTPNFQPQNLVAGGCQHPVFGGCVAGTGQEGRARGRGEGGVGSERGRSTVLSKVGVGEEGYKQKEGDNNIR